MAIQDTGIHGGYPFRPNRYNFTDIRTMQIFDPVVIGSSSVGSAFAAMSATGATLENGVRVKNTSATPLYVGVAGSNRGVNAVGNSTGGYEVLQGEEVFVEVRQLSDLLVRGNGATCGFIAS